MKIADCGCALGYNSSVGGGVGSVPWGELGIIYCQKCKAERIRASAYHQLVEWFLDNKEDPNLSATDVVDMLQTIIEDTNKRLREEAA